MQNLMARGLAPEVLVLNLNSFGKGGKGVFADL